MRQTPHGTVTAALAEAEMPGLLTTIAREPGVASVTSPSSSAGLRRGDGAGQTLAAVVTGRRVATLEA